jgi:RNA polymerase sigma-70 factor (ECF subfamily)
MQDKDEAELIAQSINGSHEAYAVLIDRYKNALYHHCFAIVRDEDAAEDIAQETFITAYYKLELYNPQYRLSTWLFKISTNKAINHLRKHAREVTADDELIANIASQEPGPLVHAQDAELHDAVQRLQPTYRAVISLYYWQGMTYEEIAQIMGSPKGSIKGWMSRAKLELRKELS